MKITKTKDGYGRSAVKIQAERPQEQDIVNVLIEFIIQRVKDDREFEFGMNTHGMNYLCVPTAPWDEVCARIAANDPEIVGV